MPTCCRAPRSISSMKGSPAICAEKRVQRAQSTQRSRSSSTWAEMLIGFGKVRLTPSKRLSPRPLDMAWFWRGHSPPLSQTGQSRGWLIRRNSMIPSCALAATGLVAWVSTTMPSATGSVQDACGLGKPRPLPASGTSTRHWRQAPTGASSGWSQNRGIATPTCSAARITRVSLGTLTCDAVDGQADRLDGRSFSGALSSGRHAVAPAGAKSVEAAASNGQPPWLRWARYSSRKNLIELEIGLTAPSASAQNERPMMLSHWSSRSSRSASLPWPCSSRASVCTSHHVPSRQGVHLPQDSCL